MSKLFWIATGASLGIGAYILLNGSNEYTYNTAGANGDDAADDLTTGARRFSRKAGAWGTGKRVSGTAGQLGGKLQEGVGNLTGDPELADRGVGNQIIGTAKDVAGKAAHAVSDTLDNLTR